MHLNEDGERRQKLVPYERVSVGVYRHIYGVVVCLVSIEHIYSKSRVNYSWLSKHLVTTSSFPCSNTEHSPTTWISMQLLS